MWVLVSDGRKQSHWYFRDRTDYARRDYITPLLNYAAAHPKKRSLQDKVAKAVATIKNDPEYIISTKTKPNYGKNQTDGSY